jgi:hypothetical protein
MEIIDKLFGWNNKWEFVEIVSEWDYTLNVFDIYKDTNKNWLVRYKKLLVNRSGSVFNQNNKLLNKKQWNNT